MDSQFLCSASGNGNLKLDLVIECMIDFSIRLQESQAARQSLLCVGLDPDPSRLPPHLTSSLPVTEAVRTFNLAIIEATSASVCCYKLNLAFYEALGTEGWRLLEDTVSAARKQHIVIADGKRCDIGNSARFYAEAVFERMGCDACTVSPYMGSDAVRPFLAFPDRAAFVLIRTSNEGARELQELTCAGKPLYARVASLASAWAAHSPGTLGFVVGATDATAVRRVREEHPETPLLVPGVGAQGGDVPELFEAISSGSAPVVVNSSRKILYASSDEDFAEAAEREAESIRALLQRSTSK